MEVAQPAGGRGESGGTRGQTKTPVKGKEKGREEREGRTGGIGGVGRENEKGEREKEGEGK